MPASQHHRQDTTASSSAAESRQTPIRRKQRHPRKPISCVPCRTSKLKCDRQLPCGACLRRDNTQRCSYGYENHVHPSPMSTPVTQSSVSRHTEAPASRHLITNQPSSSSETPENVDQNYARSSWESLWQRPEKHQPLPLSYAGFPFSMNSQQSTEDLLCLLPSPDCCDYLIIQYFIYMAPMFHVLHEGDFQKRYNAFKKDQKTDDFSWLALLFSMFSLAVQTLENNDPMLAEVRERVPSAQDSAAVATELRKISMICLSRDNFLFNYNLMTLEGLLILTYGICHDNGVDAAWTLLGLALNMGIALKCNFSSSVEDGNAVDIERRRRCWIGILSLHTYQAMLYRDIDTTSLIRTSETLLPALSDDVYPNQDTGNPSTPNQSAGTLVMHFKVRLFQLSSRICHGSAARTELDEGTLNKLDAEVAREQSAWAATFLDDGSPRVLDTTSYAHWCMLQVYAHQLYLLLHRPFCRDRLTESGAAGGGEGMTGRGGGGGGTSGYRQASRHKCITSGAALLDLQRQYVELPRLRHHRWTVHGLIGSCAVHGAMALASCLLEEQDDGMDVTPYRRSFDAAVDRIGILQSRSTFYVKAYPILRHVQTILSSRQELSRATEDVDFGESFDNWMNTIRWFDPQSINWDYWEDVVGSSMDVGANGP